MLKTTLAATAILAVATATACTTRQGRLDQMVKAQIDLEKLYSANVYTVYYDPVAQQCVAYAVVWGSNGGGTGVDTFACNPDELRSRAKELADKVDRPKI